MSTMTVAQIIDQLKIISTTAAPFLPPGISLAVTLATNAMTAVQNAQNAGADVTAAQLTALFAADDKAKADGLLAEQEAVAKGG